MAETHLNWYILERLLDVPDVDRLVQTTRYNPFAII